MCWCSLTAADFFSLLRRMLSYIFVVSAASAGRRYTYLPGIFYTRYLVFIFENKVR